MSYKPNNYAVGKRLVEKLSRYVYTAIGSVVNRFTAPMPPLFEKAEGTPPPIPFKAVGIRTPADEDDKMVVWVNEEAGTRLKAPPVNVIYPDDEPKNRSARALLKSDEIRH